MEAACHGFQHRFAFLTVTEHIRSAATPGKATSSGLYIFDKPDNAPSVITHYTARCHASQLAFAAPAILDSCASILDSLVLSC